MLIPDPSKSRSLFPPPPSTITQKLDKSKLSSFENWFVTFVDLILDKVTSDVPAICTLANTAVDTTVRGILSNSTLGRKQRKSQISSTPLILPTLDVFLAHTYLPVLADATSSAITSVLNYQKDNMSISSSSKESFEDWRWSIFYRLCRVAGSVSGRVVDVIFTRPKITVRQEGHKDKKLESFNIINARHRQSGESIKLRRCQLLRRF